MLLHFNEWTRLDIGGWLGECVAEARGFSLSRKRQRLYAACFSLSINEIQTQPRGLGYLLTDSYLTAMADSSVKNLRPPVRGLILYTGIISPRSGQSSQLSLYINDAMLSFTEH